MVFLASPEEGEAAYRPPLPRRRQEHHKRQPRRRDAPRPAHRNGHRAGPPRRHAEVRRPSAPPAVSTVSGTLALNGLYGKSGRATIGRATIEVGEDSGGEGVVVTKSLGAIVVPGTSNLESVSCLTLYQVRSRRPRDLRQG